MGGGDNKPLVLPRTIDNKAAAATDSNDRMLRHFFILSQRASLGLGSSGASARSESGRPLDAGIVQRIELSDASYGVLVSLVAGAWVLGCVIAGA
jgi:hypothetical protein